MSGGNHNPGEGAPDATMHLRPRMLVRLGAPELRAKHVIKWECGDVATGRVCD